MMPTTPGVVLAKRRDHATEARASSVRGLPIWLTSPLARNKIVTADGVPVGGIELIRRLRDGVG